MSKRLILVLTLAIVIGISAYAYAEVQNIKVSGDITTIALSRYGFNLTQPEQDASGIVAIARLRVDADLTDNVTATIRLINERVWGSAEEDEVSNNVQVDLAYVTLREFLYSPLTLIVGRQNVKLGDGLIIGDPNTNQLETSSAGLPFILADLSLRKAFDGIIGILDYSPLTLTLGMLKINEGVVNALPNQGLRANGDDVNVYLVNAAYELGDKWSSVGELYYVVADVGDDSATTLNAENSDVNNIGVRFVSMPAENLSASAEFAYQTARRTPAEGMGHRSDYAVMLAANYALPDVDWTPSFGLCYGRITEHWNPMFEDITPADIANALLPNTNCEIIRLSATAKPREDVTASLRFANLRAVDGIAGLTNNWATYTMDASKEDIGREWDLNILYDYTEDVQLGLSFGYFDAGDAFENEEDATQVIGSMKVTF